MDTNPYAAPQAQTAEESPLARRERARRLVGPPSTALLLLGGLSAPLIVSGAIFSALELFSTGGDVSKQSDLITAGYLAMQLAMAAGDALILAGAWNMHQLGSRKLALAGAWTAVIPFLSPFLYLGIPFGVWALVILYRSDVMAAFWQPFRPAPILHVAATGAGENHET